MYLYRTQESNNTYITYTYSRCHSATLSISVYNTTTDLATCMWVMSTFFLRVYAMSAHSSVFPCLRMWLHMRYMWLESLDWTNFTAINGSPFPCGIQAMQHFCVQVWNFSIAIKLFLLVTSLWNVIPWSNKETLEYSIAMSSAYHSFVPKSWYRQ